MAETHDRQRLGKEGKDSGKYLQCSGISNALQYIKSFDIPKYVFIKYITMFYLEISEIYWNK